ncbi:MAG: GDSL-type esterase/lipase family protein, partial [Planctomycetota bacterium]
MKATRCLACGLAVTVGLSVSAGQDWVEPMKKVHARFTGQAGTVGQFGDSITITMAFFNPLQGEIRNLPKDLKPAHEWLRGYVQNRCWSAWKDPSCGNNGGTTSAWGKAGIKRWLKKLNPEVALVMWGTNDTYRGPRPPEYTDNMRAVIQACLDNGTVPILYTIPPVGNQAGNERQRAHVESFVQAARQVARQKKVPLVDFYKEMMTRQPTDFPRTLLGDNLHPSYPRKYQRDFSEEGLKNSGYTLRNYLTLRALWEVQRKVLSRVRSARTAAVELSWKGPTFKHLPAVLVPAVKAAPTVDGVLDDACWKRIKPIEMRLLDGDTRKPSYPTQVRIAATDKAVYVAFRCAEPDTGKLVSRKRPRDANVWEDDSVEVFLKPGPEPTRQYHHVIVNPDASILDDFAGGKEWDGGVAVGVHKGKGFWSAEIALPLAKMKLPGKARLRGAWRLNLTRSRPARGEDFTEETALSPTESASSHVPGRFAYAWFEALGGKLPT